MAKRGGRKKNAAAKAAAAAAGPQSQQSAVYKRRVSKSSSSGTRGRENQTVVTFSEADRKNFINGFRARKNGRRKEAIEKIVQKERLSKIAARKAARESALKENGKTTLDLQRELAAEQKRLFVDASSAERTVMTQQVESEEAVVTTVVSEFNFDGGADDERFFEVNEDSSGRNAADGAGDASSAAALARSELDDVDDSPMLTASELRKAVARAQKTKGAGMRRKPKRVLPKREKHKNSGPGRRNPGGAAQRR